MKSGESEVLLPTLPAHAWGRDASLDDVQTLIWHGGGVCKRLAKNGSLHIFRAKICKEGAWWVAFGSKIPNAFSICSGE